ncbi:MAG: hypothetical protein J1D88_07880 [Treponema sp.]|nr:hypothetical protein [Treponema sp.]
MRIPDYLETDGTKITGCKESDMPKKILNRKDSGDDDDNGGGIIIEKLDKE